MNYKKGDILTEQQSSNVALNKFPLQEMELKSKLLEQIAFNTRPKLEEHTLIVVDKSIHEEHLSEPLQTKIKQVKVAVIYLTGCNRIFFVTNGNNIFIFISVFERAEYNVISIPPRAYHLDISNKDIKRMIIDEKLITEEEFPLTIKPNFSTLGSNIEITPSRGWQSSFVQDDTSRDILDI